MIILAFSLIFVACSQDPTAGESDTENNIKLETSDEYLNTNFEDIYDDYETLVFGSDGLDANCALELERRSGTYRYARSLGYTRTGDLKRIDVYIRTGSEGSLCIPKGSEWEVLREEENDDQVRIYLQLKDESSDQRIMEILSHRLVVGAELRKYLALLAGDERN